MRAFVSVVVFLIAVFEQANSLNCLYCIDAGSDITNCVGKSIPVPDDVEYCIKGMENNILGDSVRTTSYRGYLETDKPNICGANLFLTVVGFNLLLNMFCCREDNCNDGLIPAPQVDSVPNGFECPTCLTQETDATCIPKETIPCTGNQQQCITFQGTAKRPGADQDFTYYYFKGCVSTGGCDVGLANLPGTVPGNYTITCDAANLISHNGGPRRGGGVRH